MEKKLALVLVLVVLACGAAWWALRGNGGARGVGPEVAREPAPAAKSAEPAPAALVAAQTTPTSERSTPAQREAAAPADAFGREHETFALEGARWLDVTVLLPAGAPRDDEPELIGFARKDGEEDEDWFANQAGLDLDDSFLERVRARHEWAQRPLAPHVRMPFPAAAAEGLLFLQSRYQHLEARIVDLAQTSALTLAPELGGWVTGRCTFPADARVDAASIAITFEAHPKGEDPAGIGRLDSRRARVAPNLTFELRGLSAEKSYLAHAEAKGYLGYSEPSVEVSPGEHRELTIAFRTGAAVSGVVRGEGRPLEFVEVSTDDAIWGSPPSTKTDANGAFRLSGLPEGEVTLSAKKDGWREGKSETLTLIEGQELRGIEIVLDPGARISGLVQWPDGSPAVEASVKAMLPEAGWMQEAGQSESDASGAFQLGGLEEKALDVFAERSARDGAAGSWHALQRGVTPGASGLVLVLLPPLPVVGTVVDDTGAPVQSFDVEARPADTPVNSPEEVQESFVDAGGSFHLEVARPGEWSFTAHSDAPEGDGEARDSESVTLTVPQGLAPLRLVIPRACTIAGHVLDPRGHPLAGAAIEVGSDPDEMAFGMPGDEQAHSDAEGRFEVTNAKMPCTLKATHADWAPSEPVALALAPGEARDDVVLVLRVGGRITGEVLDADGRPEAGQNVNCGSGAMAVMSMGFGGENSTRSDAAGRFAFEHVPPGKVTVSAVPSQEELMAQLQSGNDQSAFVEMLGGMRSATVELADGGEAHVVLGAKPKRPVRVHGRVTLAGAPLAEKQVLAMAEGGALFQGMKAAQTGADGRYEIRLDRPGDYVFGVSVEENTDGTGTPFYVAVPEVDELEQDFALPLGRIAGVVLGPDGPVGGIPLRLVASAGTLGLDDLSESHHTSSASDGSFAFETLQPGTYALHVGSEFGGETSDAHFGQVVVDGLRVAEDRATDGIVVRLEPGGSLAGTVRDAAGNPVAGVAIYVRDAAGRAISFTSCVSDAAGRYTYAGVAPGRVSASARSTTLVGPESAQVEVRAGATTSLDLVVASGTFLRVALLEGDHAVRARLSVVDEAGRRVDDLVSMEAFGTLLSEGFSSRERRVGPLAPGKYTLTATAMDGKQTQKSLRVEAGQEELRVQLRLE